jgi:glycosyltransferase involved in cell wall biosynthesis
MLIRGPSPLLPSVAVAAASLPTALLLVGDYVAGVDSLPQPWWRRELIRSWSKWNQRKERRVARRSLTFVNSRKLYNELRPRVPNLIETRTTTLSASDFTQREDTCAQRPIRLLYTGRMDCGKGLLEIAEALGQLLSQGEDVILDLVGWPVQGDDILQQIRDLAATRGYGGRVTYRGHRALGPELFAFYKQADIYIIASKSSEGFPRTIWEAMAHCVPVIATRVGSIPDFAAPAAMLVDPCSVSGLVEAVRKVIGNPALRQNMIKRGLELARAQTLERHVPQMVAGIQSWVARRK